MRTLIIVSVIFLLTACNCDDCGESKKYSIVITNLTSNSVTLSAEGFLVVINVEDEYRLEGTSAADEPAPTALTYESITFTFDDGKILTYSADISVVINNIERNPLTGDSYEYELIDNIPTYFYSITTEDYNRAM